MCSDSDGRLALSGQPLLVVVPFRCARYRPQSARMTEQVIGRDRRGRLHDPNGSALQLAYTERRPVSSDL